MRTSPQQALLAAVLHSRTSGGVASSSAVLPSPSLTEFEAACAKQYAHDPWFSDPTHVEDLRQERELFFLDSRLVVPDGEGLREVCFAHAHSSAYAGHPGYLKTLKLLERSYWWPKMLSSLKESIQQCPSCQQKKSTNQKPGGLLQSLPIPPAPWSSVSMDLIASLPLTAADHTAIVGFVHRLSKMAHFVPTNDNVSAKEFARLFQHHVIRLQGCPVASVSDRGPRFTSQVFTELCACWALSKICPPLSTLNQMARLKG